MARIKFRGMTELKLQHKPYMGLVEVDAESQILHARVVELRGVISFQGIESGDSLTNSRSHNGRPFPGDPGFHL
jgi:hypothetical protein